MLTVDALKTFLASHVEEEFPSAHAAFRTAVAAAAPGMTIGVHESHISLAGERIPLPSWARTLLGVLDRPSLRRPLRGKVMLEILEALEASDWRPIDTDELATLLA